MKKKQGFVNIWEPEVSDNYGGQSKSQSVHNILIQMF